METTTASNRRGLFITHAGQNVAFTFVLVTSLFLLWGFCNGLIDVMDKHFQNELGIHKIAIGLGAVRALSRLFSHVDPGRLAGHETGL